MKKIYIKPIVTIVSMETTSILDVSLPIDIGGPSVAEVKRYRPIIIDDEEDEEWEETTTNNFFSGKIIK